MALMLLLNTALSAGSQAGVSIVPTDFSDSRMAGSLAEPVGLAIIPDGASPPGTRVLFIEQRTARVGMILGGSVTTVGTVPGVASLEGERGLLGIAVDPLWPAAPYIYVHCTDARSVHTIAISRFTLTGDVGFTGGGTLAMSGLSRYDLRRDLPDNAETHNGGTVRFGPDGMLYVSLGDDEIQCNSQDITQLAGKILRLDVRRLPSGSGGPAPFALLTPSGNPYATNPDSSSHLVWARGMRNPFRFHIDPVSGSLLVADVGQSLREELDWLSAPGPNLGWPFFEGDLSYSTCPGGTPSGLTTPIYTYDHVAGRAVVSAGVYRPMTTSAATFPVEYNGDCFFLDYYTGMLRRLKGSGASWSIAPPVPGQPSSLDWGRGFQQVSDVVEPPDGSLWYVRQSEGYAAGTGEVRRVVHINTQSVAVDGPPGAFTALSFAAPAPTPSGPSGARLAWTQSGAGIVRLVIYDLRGRVIRVVEPGILSAPGAHERHWDGHSTAGDAAASGLYLARLQVGADVQTRRIVLVR